MSVAGWPACLDCISFSTDSEIALANGEVIDLFLPKLSLDPQAKIYRETEEHNWDRLRFVINTFTEEESPYIDPQPFGTFSIGEEQSLSHATAVAWSPGGVARDRKCALAVLTSNHVLSIWACDGDPTDSKSWGRVLIINKCLHGLTKEDSGSELGTGDVRSRTRIRAFSWIGNAKNSNDFSDAHARQLLPTSQGHHLFVTNDLGEVVAIQLQSPFNNLSSTVLTWRAEVLSFSSVLPLNSLRVTQSTNFLMQHYFVTHLDVTPWVRKGAVAFSTIAYIVAQNLVLQRCVLSTSESGSVFTFGDRIAVLEEAVHLGPIRWSFDVRNDKKDFCPVLY